MKILKIVGGDFNNCYGCILIFVGMDKNIILKSVMPGCETLNECKLSPTGNKFEKYIPTDEEIPEIFKLLFVGKQCT
jgi:hypothetical protein